LLEKSAFGWGQVPSSNLKMAEVQIVFLVRHKSSLLLILEARAVVPCGSLASRRYRRIHDDIGKNQGLYLIINLLKGLS